MFSLKLLFLTYFVTITLGISLAEGGTPFQKEKPHYEHSKDVYYTSPNTTLSTSCGEVLNSTGGVISYRPNQPLVQNERCVWMIRGGNPSGYTINVRVIGFPSSGYSNQVIATCFILGYSDPIHRVLSQTSFSLSPCDVLMITFHTGTNVGGSTGFLLEYNAQIIGGGNAVSRSSTDMIFDGDFAVLRHPTGSAQYSNNEITTFVLPPSGNMNSAYKRTNVAFFEDALENCCDIVQLYVFF